MQQQGNVKWIKPTEGRFKCNIDVSFSQFSNRVGIRVCIRDDTCTFVLVETELLLHSMRYLLAKLLDCYQFWNVLINYIWDLSILNLMQKKWWIIFHLHITNFGMIIHNCKTIFEQYYVNSCVEFVRWQANKAAHRFAKEATPSYSFQILVEIPDCIEHMLSNEMM